MKGILRVGGALLVGILIILGALYVEKNTPSSPTTKTAVVSPSPSRTHIEEVDSDNDGISDWEESLNTKVFEAIEAASSSVAWSVSDEPYEPPSTFTGQFSEAFFKDYLSGKIQGEDYSDPTALVETAVGAIEQNTQSKRHTRNELTIISTTPESLHAYGNKVAEIMQNNSTGNENEALILQRALESNDPSVLQDLDPIFETYVRMIDESLLMPVPDLVAGEHIALLNAYESIRTDIEAMRVAFDDPLYALARIRGYQDDATALFVALQNILLTLDAEGVRYTNVEPGAFFYLFET